MKLRSRVLELTALAAVVAMTAAGCGDNRVASKANLQQALNRDYSQYAECLFSRPLAFPYELSVNDKLMTETRRGLDALAETGLLNRERKVRQDGAVNRYVLTAAGTKAAGDGSFCYGRRQVTSVEKFTPPVDYRGMPLTRVEYRFVLKDRASWTAADEVRKAFPPVAKATAPQPVDEATVVLTHEGWVLTY